MHKLIYGFGVFLLLFVLSTAFYSSYQVSRLQAEVRRLEEEGEESLHTDAKPLRQGYYLEAVGDYVWVYEGDRTTVYESTGIALESLPSRLQAEIRKGKYLDTELELYGFLENYSS